jgi:MFS family permease
VQSGKTRKRLGGRFWRVWAATGVSSVGDGMVLVALPLLALTYTRSPVAVAGVLVAGRLPAIFVALPAGAIADRVNRRRLVVAIEAARFAVLAAFGMSVVTRSGGIAALYATAFLLGGLTLSFDIVSGAALPSIVGRDQLVQANAHLMNADMTGEEMVGPALGGAAFSLARSVPFLADALSFVASGVLLRRALPDNAPAPPERSIWGDLVSGLRWFVGQPVLRLMTSIITTLAFCQAMVVGVLVIYATERLHLSSAGYGLLIGVASVGDVVGAFSASRLHRRLGSGVCIALAGTIAALAYPVMALTQSAVVAAAALMAEYFAVTIGNVAARSLRQSSVPDGMQGRAASSYQLMILGTFPLGGLLGGLLAGGFGVRTTLFAAGAAQLVVVAVATPRLVSRLRAQNVVDLTAEKESPTEVLAS